MWVIDLMCVIVLLLEIYDFGFVMINSFLMMFMMVFMFFFEEGIYVV